MAQKALIVWGGWDGHEPGPVSQFFGDLLRDRGFDVEISDSLDAFLDRERLKALDLIVPVWTMGEIKKEQLEPVIEAVANGVGLAGCHGGMCDSFRTSTQWQFMCGGQWVAHPGGDGTKYTVNIKHGSSPIVQGLDDFEVESEQYYMHVDPANEVLATTRYPTVDGPHAANGAVDVPVVWTRRWARGRVFYCSLGHHRDILESEPTRTLVERGFLWAADGKRIAEESGGPEMTFDQIKSAF